jgi:hypothetical protein
MPFQVLSSSKRLLKVGALSTVVSHHQPSGVSYIAVMYLIRHVQFHMAMVQNGEGIVPVITWDWFSNDVHGYLPQSTKDAVCYLKC